MPLTPHEDFCALCHKVMEGIASPDEVARFNRLVEREPACLEAYWQQMQADSLLTCCCGGLASVQDNTSQPRRKVRVSTAAAVRFVKIAAAVAVLALTAAGIWLAEGDGRLATGDRQGVAVANPPPIEVSRHWAACNLEVPESLPGTMRMSGGQIKARLGPGIEMILLGPFELEVQTPTKARLVSGRMLATIPWKHGGFTLRTPDLEMWDNGAVYCASVTDSGSDIFVFKGEAQVVEACGEPVDICRAGEGVRVRRDGSGTVKVEANWPEGERILARVMAKDVAKAPEEALLAASRVSDGWAERWMPKVVERPKPVPGLRGGRQPAVASRNSDSRTLIHESQQTSIDSGGTVPAANKAALPQRQEEAMKATVKSAAAMAAAVTMGAGAVWAVPVVSNVNMQQIPNTRLVQVTYDLADESAIVTLSIETNGVAIPDSAVTRLSGDVCKVVEAGNGKSIIWNAGADWPENETENAKARVTAWALDTPPLYCAIDVSGGTAATSYPVYYYPSAGAVPGGVTNHLYKTLRILMRQIPPTGGEGFTMGSPVNETGRNTDREAQVQAVLTKGYYIGVYQVTQGQWQQVMGDIRPWPAKWNNNDYRLTRPVEQVSYYYVRENAVDNKDDPDVNWPSNDVVNADSFMGRLRTKTGLAGFDLPTEAQWEYACRAGTTGALNDGTVNITNTLSDARVGALGRYRFNGGMIWDGVEWVDPEPDCTTENATAAVGSYAPNAWGLYDMYGNVLDLCLDWLANTITGGIDPQGPDTGQYRVLRGSCWVSVASSCRSAVRGMVSPHDPNRIVGFRIVRTLP
jgi:formylglycine-generating enzyme required for sulfatase activity